MALAAAAMPVPDRAIDCGEPAALSLMVTAAVTALTEFGSKFKLMVQAAPAARLFPQVVAKRNEEACAPVSAALVMVSATFPVFVSCALGNAKVALVALAMFVPLKRH